MNHKILSNFVATKPKKKLVEIKNVLNKKHLTQLKKVLACLYRDWPTNRVKVNLKIGPAKKSKYVFDNK